MYPRLLSVNDDEIKAFVECRFNFINFKLFTGISKNWNVSLVCELCILLRNCELYLSTCQSSFIWNSFQIRSCLDLVDFSWSGKKFRILPDLVPQHWLKKTLTLTFDHIPFIFLPAPVPVHSLLLCAAPTRILPLSFLLHLLASLLVFAPLALLLLSFPPVAPTQYESQIII